MRNIRLRPGFSDSQGSSSHCKLYRVRMERSHGSARRISGLRNSELLDIQTPPEVLEFGNGGGPRAEDHDETGARRMRNSGLAHQQTV